MNSYKTINNIIKIIDILEETYDSIIDQHIIKKIKIYFKDVLNRLSCKEINYLMQINQNEAIENGLIDEWMDLTCSIIQLSGFLLPAVPSKGIDYFKEDAKIEGFLDNETPLYYLSLLNRYKLKSYEEVALDIKQRRKK